MKKIGNPHRAYAFKLNMEEHKMSEIDDYKTISIDKRFHTLENMRQ